MADYVKEITLTEVYAHFGYCSFCGADNKEFADHELQKEEN